jgi:uncharacterized protein (TIGR03083 family)
VRQLPGVHPKDHVLAERAELVALLGSLGPDEWSTQSLCGGWTLRDIAAHIGADAVPMPRYLLGCLRNPSTDRANNHFVRLRDDLSTEELTDLLSRSADVSWFRRYAPRLALADHLVHQQDIRRPLGLPREIDPERLRLVLDHPDPFARPRRYTRGLRFVASDISWNHGEGSEIRGKAEALVMAMVGRPSVLDELEGVGVDELRGRMHAAGAS